MLGSLRVPGLARTLLPFGSNALDGTRTAGLFRERAKLTARLVLRRQGFARQMLKVVVTYAFAFDCGPARPTPRPSDLIRVGLLGLPPA